MANLRRAINVMNIGAMERAYHGQVVDGTQWILLVRVDGKEKSVYFDNNFPKSIRTFSSFVHQAILEPLADPVESEVVPARHHRKHEKAIWASIQ